MPSLDLTVPSRMARVLQDRVYNVIGDVFGSGPGSGPGGQARDGAPWASPAPAGPPVYFGPQNKRQRRFGSNR